MRAEFAGRLQPVVCRNGAYIHDADGAFGRLDDVKAFVYDIHLDRRHQHVIAARFRAGKHLVAQRDLIEREGNLLLNLVADDLRNLVFRNGRQRARAREHRLPRHTEHGFPRPDLRLLEQVVQHLRDPGCPIGLGCGRRQIKFPLQVLGQLKARLCLSELTHPHRTGANVQYQPPLEPWTF